jgi:hypothetical protein
MTGTAPPPKTKYAAGLLVTVGCLALIAAAVDTVLAGPNASKLQADHGYDEGGGTDGYHFAYHVRATGPGAERTLARCVAAVAGAGFLAFGVRLVRGTAATVIPAAALAALLGVAVGYASARAAGDGRATLGLPGMGFGFVLVVAAALLVAGRGEYKAWRRARSDVRTKPDSAVKFVGGVLLVYGLAVAGLAVSRTVSWLEPVRGRPTAVALRAEVSASTSIEFLGNAMKSTAEKNQSFTPGYGFFLHPQAVACAWGGVWAAAGLGVLRGRASRRLGWWAVAAAAVVVAFAGLSLVTVLPWYAATPDGLFPGSLIVLAVGLVLLVRPASVRPA